MGTDIVSPRLTDPGNDRKYWMIDNDGIDNAKRIVNDFANNKRVFSGALITPNQPGWLDEVDRAIETLKPDSWKSYTIGDPLSPSKYPWRLDDEKIMYPFYEKVVIGVLNEIRTKSGIRKIDQTR